MGDWKDRGGFAAPPDRRSDPRYQVDEESVVLFVGYGAPLQARLVDLSQEGCRLRTAEPVNARSRLPVEVFFKVNGASFRFRGVLQWTDGKQVLGIRFVNMVPQRMVELAKVICSMEGSAETTAGLELLAEPRGMTQAPLEPPAESQPARKSVGRERRQQARFEVDTSATIFLVHVASNLRGRILDLSLNGCRIRTDERFPVGIYTRVETEFRLEGLPFRLGGVIQSIHDRNTVGIRFLDMSLRKREQVLELIGEIEEMRAVQGIAAEDHSA
ncbi:MAG TPA: PilZ domain-containing protein [Terracidiphilus sp.]|nr:PilZ domain-containing protein [Terracidiphilus sp.]